MHGYSEDFAAAMEATARDSEQLCPPDGDLFDAPEMLTVGLLREDALRFMASMMEEYGHELSEGGPPANACLLTIIELSMSIGVHIERIRNRRADAEIEKYRA